MICRIREQVTVGRACPSLQGEDVGLGRGPQPHLDGLPVAVSQISRSNSISAANQDI
jgi:hypothetical protein